MVMLGNGMGMFQLVALGSGQDEGELKSEKKENSTQLQLNRFRPRVQNTREIPRAKRQRHTDSCEHRQCNGPHHPQGGSQWYVFPAIQLLCNSPKSTISKIHHVLVLGRMGKSNGEFYKFMIFIFCELYQKLCNSSSIQSFCELQTATSRIESRNSTSALAFEDSSFHWPGLSRSPKMVSWSAYGILNKIQKQENRLKQCTILKNSHMIRTRNRIEAW